MSENVAGRCDWRPLAGKWKSFPYEVTSDGRVKHAGGSVPLSEHKCCRGYARVTLNRGKRGRHHAMVHRLVYEAFSGIIPDGMTINHVDFNKTNNAIENLECVSQRENVMHAVRAGRFGATKLTEQVVIEIRRMSASGMNQSEIGRQLGVSQGNVSAIVRRKTWTHI